MLKNKLLKLFELDDALCNVLADAYCTPKEYEYYYSVLQKTRTKIEKLEKILR